MSDAKKLSSQEAIKRESDYLRGSIKEELADLSRNDITDAAYELLKFHGSYFGYDRDTQLERKKAGLEKKYEFMVRTRIPGGRLNASQYLAMDDIAGLYANGTLRITTRQVFQFHVILKKDMKAHIAAINNAMLSTLGGCGDVVRNITCSPAPYKNAKYEKLRSDCDRIAEFCKPKTKGYRELWLDEEADEVRERTVKLLPGDDEVETLYGITYMPRKFKIGIILPEDNSVDVFTHDLGVVLVYEGDEFKGYNILIGGGMGMKHEAVKSWDEKKTYPRLADPIAFVGPDDLLHAVEAVVKIQRDFGDRTDRQHARIKYLVEERGVEWIRQTFEEYFAKVGGGKVSDPVVIPKYEMAEHMGWHEQGDGKLFLGLKIPSGRIVDYDKEDISGYTKPATGIFKTARYRTGLRAVVDQFRPNIVLTPTGEMILSDIDPKDTKAIEATLAEYGIPLESAYTPMQLHFFTCVALPTCAKALAESERVQFPVMDGITEKLARHGLQDEKMTIRIAGCPNGCSRPYVGDIGIVGRMPDHYALFIGGDFEGTRLAEKIFDRIPYDKLTTTLDPMFALFAQKKNSGEGFGDFCARIGVENVKQHTIATIGEDWVK
jgi:sulfite reductase (ferredoxin)